MRSDQAWVAGHRAALRLTPLWVVTTVVSLVALWAGGLWASSAVAMIIGAAGVLAFVPIALYSAVVAGRAAKRAEDPDIR